MKDIVFKNTVTLLETSVSSFPLLEITLTGTFPFEVLVEELSINLPSAHKLLQVDLEFLKSKNFGRIVLSLFGKPIEHELFFQFLNQSNVDFQIIGQGNGANAGKSVLHQKVTAGSYVLKNKKD